MEELKKLITDKTAITNEQAAQVINVISEYIKERVPPIMHSQLDKVLDGHSMEDNIKNQLIDIGNEIKTKAEGLAKDLQTTFDKAFSSKK